MINKKEIYEKLNKGFVINKYYFNGYTLEEHENFDSLFNIKTTKEHHEYQTLIDSLNLFIDLKIMYDKEYLNSVNTTSLKAFVGNDFVLFDKENKQEDVHKLLIYFLDNQNEIMNNRINILEVGKNSFLYDKFKKILIFSEDKKYVHFPALTSFYLDNIVKEIRK